MVEAAADETVEVGVEVKMKWWASGSESSRGVVSRCCGGNSKYRSVSKAELHC